MRGRVIAVVIGLLAGACSTSHAPAPPRTDGSTPRSLTMQPAVDHVGLRAREPMVVEHPSGTLFVAGRQLWLARSTDQGRGWTKWPIALAADATYYPYLIAQGAGQLAATWFTGPVASLEAHVARIRAADTGGAPELAPAPAFRPDAWRRGQKPGEARARDTAGEYFPVAFLRDGSLGVVTTIQDDQRNRYGFSWWRAVEH